MQLAGKYMMEEFAPRTVFKNKMPRNAFTQGKGATTLTNFGGMASLMQVHPQIAFDAQGLGFSPHYPSY